MRARFPPCLAPSDPSPRRERPITLPEVPLDRPDDIHTVAGAAVKPAPPATPEAPAPGPTTRAGRVDEGGVLVLLAGMDARAAHKAAERLRHAISASPVRHGQTKIPITISVGVASVYPGAPADLASLIERADGALYAAKQAGRDRIVVAD